MTQNTSFANFALTQEQAFSYKADDRALVKAGKFTVATAITTSSFALAIVETALSALAAAILSPSNLTRFNGAYKAAAKHTKDSAQTVALAARRTFGIKQQQPAPKPLDKTRVQKFKDFIQTSVNKVSEKASPVLARSKEYKGPIAAATLTAAIATAYFFAPEGIVFDTAENIRNLPCTLFVSGMELKDRAVELVSPSDEPISIPNQELPSDANEIVVLNDVSTLFTKTNVVGGVLTLTTATSLIGCTLR